MADKTHESRESPIEEGEVIKRGYLKKLKTKQGPKKRYFVLYEATADQPAGLKYFASEKTFKKNQQPTKPPVIIKSCFSINKKTDSKHKHAIALYTETDWFAIVADSEEEQDSWLKALWEIQYGQSEDGEVGRPQFEHVWQVTIKEKGLGSNKIETGPYRLCLTDKTLSLVKACNAVPSYTFQLPSIRRCGHSDCFFYMEVGRHASTGDGQIWMHVDDNVIAQSMHEAILSAMKNAPTETLPRSSGSVSTRSRRPRSNTNQGLPARSRTISESTSGSPRATGESLRPVSVMARKETRSPVSGLSPGVAEVGFRVRSDSVDSRGTSSSVSTGDEYESSPKLQHTGLRPLEATHPLSAPIIIPQVPYSHSKDKDGAYAYMDMTPVNKNYMDMTPGTLGDDHLSTTPNSTSLSSSPAVSVKSGISEDPAYFDMTPSSYMLPTVQEKIGMEGYMCMQPGSSPSLGSSPAASLRPTKAYISESGLETPKRHYSVGSRPNSGKQTTPRSKPFMEEIARQGSLDASKSCSAPHLIPSNITAAPISSAEALFGDQEHFMEMEFRPRTGSDIGYMTRPRTSSWSQCHRPRAASHGHKSREKKIQVKLASNSSARSSQDSLKSFDSRKLSSESLTKEGYMDMSFHHSRSNSQPSRNISTPADYMHMSPGSSNDKLGTGQSKAGDYVKMNPPSVHGKSTPVEDRASPKLKENYMSMSPVESHVPKLSPSSKSVPVLKFTTAASSDSDSSTSGCHSSHSDSASPRFDMKANKEYADSNGRGSLSQGSEPDDGLHMSFDAGSKVEDKSDTKQTKSEVPDSYMPIIYGTKSVKRKQSKGKKDKTLGSVDKQIDSCKQEKKIDSSKQLDSYMTFLPGTDVGQKVTTAPEKVSSYIKSTELPDSPKTPSKSKSPDLPTKSKPSKKTIKHKLVVASGGDDQSSDYAMMSVSPDKPVAKQPEQIISRKTNLPSPIAIKTTNLSSLTVTKNTNLPSPVALSKHPNTKPDLFSSNFDSSMIKPSPKRPSVTEPLSPGGVFDGRSSHSRHSSGTSTSETESQLNYASLDLSDSSSGSTVAPKSPRKNRNSSADSADTDSPHMYSQIDFVKSEALKAEPTKLRENRTSFSDLS